MKYINRILIMIFSLLLLSGFVYPQSLFFAALLAIPLGGIQFLYCISLGFGWETLNSKAKVFIGGYLLTVITYFIVWFQIFKFNFSNLTASLFFIGLPIVLALAVTVFLEQKKFDQ